MSNQAEPKNGVQKYILTTESLGIADANAKDLAGFVLNQEDISTAVMKILINVGIDTRAIRAVKVGCDENKNLKILAEIKKKSINKKEPREHNWLDIESDYYEDEDKVFSKEFFNTLKNKVYYKHLKYKTVVRRDKKRNNVKYIQVEFDPKILIAFVYNLNYMDDYYRVSCFPIQWPKNKKNKKKYNKRKQEYITDRLRSCLVFVTFRIDKTRENNMYNTLVENIATGISEELNVEPNIAKEIITKTCSNKEFFRLFNRTLSSGNFHPSQVVKWESSGEYDEDDDDEDED